jgi:Ca-activated chloride channel family protein
MNLNPGQPPQLVFGDTQGKRLAEQFIAGVVADGGTRHVEALTAALEFRPDVIFFLTDADEPRLSDAELRKIKDRNRGTSINTIEFGSGPSSGQYSFLQKLAAQNDGKHVYLDVTSLPSN